MISARCFSQHPSVRKMSSYESKTEHDRVGRPKPAKIIFFNSRSDFAKLRSAIYSISSKAIMIKQCNAVTTKNEFSLYCKSHENRAGKKSGSEKLIKSPRNRLAGAVLNKPLVRVYCCGATEGIEQQHNQDLKEIYKGRRILEFITFYHNALHLTRVHCATNNSNKNTGKFGG